MSGSFNCYWLMVPSSLNVLPESPLRRRQTENSLLSADRVASPIFDLVAGNSLLRALNVASPILDLKRGSSSLWSGLNYLASWERVASPINLKSFLETVCECLRGCLWLNAYWLLLLDDAIKTALSSSWKSLWSGSCLRRCFSWLTLLILRLFRFFGFSEFERDRSLSWGSYIEMSSL